MIYNEVCGDTLSMLGFGTMRLPLLADGSIDEAQVQQMVDYAMENGVDEIKRIATYQTKSVTDLIEKELSDNK